MNNMTSVTRHLHNVMPKFLSQVLYMHAKVCIKGNVTPKLFS